MSTIDDRAMDAVFQALAHEARRRMLDLIKADPGIPVGALASAFDVSRIAVMKHLAVLEAADLVVSRKEGRVRRLYFNAVPIRLIHDRWTDELGAHFADEALSIKARAESRTAAQKKPERGKA